ncbi:hypothetical protein Plhal304r1_c086g0169361 [Plasmopara halstedii]
MNSPNAEALMSRVIIGLETFRATPDLQSVAEDLERLIVVKPTYKFLVFQNWIITTVRKMLFAFSLASGKKSTMNLHIFGCGLTTSSSSG